jgi:hypothetical protein
MNDAKTFDQLPVEVSIFFFKFKEKKMYFVDYLLNYNGIHF